MTQSAVQTDQIRSFSVSGELKHSRVRYGGLEDVQHAVARLVPGLRGEFLSVQDDHVLQTVGARAGELLVVCRQWGEGGGRGRKRERRGDVMGTLGTR